MNDYTRSKVVKIERQRHYRDASELIWFDTGVVLGDYHSQDCCEQHYLDINDLELSDFEGLEFDLSGDRFFEQVTGYGIRLVPVIGHSISIPGYSSNNGYYSNSLTLILKFPRGREVRYDITHCQKDLY